MKNKLLIILLTAVCSAMTFSGLAQDKRRHITPVQNANTRTQSVNEGSTDTARINAAIRARSTHYHNDRGQVVYVDTITGVQWIDSMAFLPAKKMKYPLLESASAGLNLWDPIMRVFGQKYGLADIHLSVSLHNRYRPSLVMGLGQALRHSDIPKYTYRSPLSVFFKLGCEYNFLFNSNPDYQFYAGAYYGITPFSFSVDNFKVGSDYWDSDVNGSIPSQKCVAGYYELVAGLRVKLYGPISAGWTFKFHGLAHCSKPSGGEPWYIPGYGTRGRSVTGAFSVYYTMDLSRFNRGNATTDSHEADSE